MANVHRKFSMYLSNQTNSRRLIDFFHSCGKLSFLRRFPTEPIYMKKMNNRPFHFSFPLSCFFVLFLFLPSFVFADEPNETFLFKKLAVLDMDDLTEKACGKEIG